MGTLLRFTLVITMGTQRNVVASRARFYLMWVLYCHTAQREFGVCWDPGHRLGLLLVEHTTVDGQNPA